MLHALETWSFHQACTLETLDGREEKLQTPCLLFYSNFSSLAGVPPKPSGCFSGSVFFSHSGQGGICNFCQTIQKRQLGEYKMPSIRQKFRIAVGQQWITKQQLDHKDSHKLNKQKYNNLNKQQLDCKDSYKQNKYSDFYHMQILGLQLVQFFQSYHEKIGQTTQCKVSSL